MSFLEEKELNICFDNLPTKLDLLLLLVLDPAWLGDLKLTHNRIF